MLNKSNSLHNVLIAFNIAALSLVGCGDPQHTKDLSGIDLDMKTIHFEQALFACRSVEDITKLATDYPDFYDIYTNDIVAANVKGPESTPEDIAVELYKYISHPDMDSLYSITQGKYADFDKYEKELETVSKYIQYYFPADHIDQTTTFISTFQYGAVYDPVNQSFGIGLDMYLGSNFEVYSMLNPQNFPLYRIKKFEPHRIVPNCVQTYADYKVPQYSNSKFIDEAVAEGKRLYLLDLLMPGYHDSLKINYNAGQIEYCEAQEKNMWGYLVQEEVLFSSDKNNYQRNFFNEGPFTAPFGNESPPRTGAWIGWQIVRKYMDANPEITIHDLLKDEDHRAIFQKSGYRP